MNLTSFHYLEEFRKDQKEKGATEDEMVRWYHQLNEQVFEQTPGDSEGQGTWCTAVHGVTEIQ